MNKKEEALEKIKLYNEASTILSSLAMILIALILIIRSLNNDAYIGF